MRLAPEPHALALIRARADAYLSWTTLTPGPPPDADAIAADVVLLCDIAEAAARFREETTLWLPWTPDSTIHREAAEAIEAIDAALARLENA